MEQRPKASDALPVRRTKFSDISQLPKDYSTTPGGSIFSTTPGGTRIFYDREQVLMCKNSPIARSPPTGLACIPGVTCPANCDKSCHRPPPAKPHSAETPTADEPCQPEPPNSKGDEESFEIDL
nr:unnamed protein product [Spirometra erinaceieuropaei]